MYFVQVMYPRVNDRFDLDHYRNVHQPMGKGAMLRYEGVKPVQSWIGIDTFGMDRTPESAAYHLIATQIFEERDEAEAFVRLFENPELAEMFEADWPKYTDAPPVCVLGRLVDPGLEATLEKSDQVLRDAGAPS
jgi:hypothetical protein